MPFDLVHAFWGIQCAHCAKTFTRKKLGTRLNERRDGCGNRCYGRVGADRTIEVPAELGMVPTDADYPLPDCTGHADSSTLGRGGGSAITTTEANSARQLSDEEVAFGTGLRGPLGVPERSRLLDVVFDLREVSAVRILGTCVEHFAGIAECPARQFGRQTALRRRSAGGVQAAVMAR